MLTRLIKQLKTRFTSDWQQIDWQRTGLLIGLILALFAALWQFAMPTVRTITTTEFRRVPEIHKIESVKRVVMSCPESGIVVLDKSEVTRKLKFDFLQGGDIANATTPQPPPFNRKEGEFKSPPPVLGGAGGGTVSNLQITASADLPDSANGYEAVSTIDLSGVSQIMAREKASPWFQFRNDAALGIKYGVNQQLIYTGTVYGRWDFLRVKDVYLSTNADLSTDGRARLQFGTEYRW